MGNNGVVLGAIAALLLACGTPPEEPTGQVSRGQSGSVPWVAGYTPGGAGQPGAGGFMVGSGGLMHGAGTGGAGGGVTGGAGGAGVGTGGDLAGAGGGLTGTGGAVEGGVNGMGGAMVGSGGAMGTGGERASVVSVSFTTTDIGGRYSPRNIGAAWIEGDGGWVKTLEVWAWIRARYLSAYSAANPVGNTVDAVTGATKSRHGSHSLTWNLTDGSGAPVADGGYTLLVEMTDHDGTGELLRVPFELGPPGTSVSGASAQGFSQISIDFQ